MWPYYIELLVLLLLAFVPYNVVGLRPGACVVVHVAQ